MDAALIQFDIKSEHLDNVLDALLEDARGSLRDEMGTLRFEVIRDDTDPNRVYLYEAYTDEAAFQTHVHGPHFRKFMERTKDQWTWTILGRGTRLFPAHSIPAHE